MDTSSRFKIDFRDISADGEAVSWHLDDSFFSELDEQEIEQGSIDATLRVNKTVGGFTLNFDAKGLVWIPCDRCLESMQQDIDAHDTIKVRMGETREDDGDIITIPNDDPTLDVTWKLFETIALAIPISHVHPEGECAQQMETLLNRHCAGKSTETDETPHTDQRWEALRSLMVQNEDNIK